MNPNEKPMPLPRYKKVRVYRTSSGDWAYRCLNCANPYLIPRFETHAQAVHAANQHMTLHTTARPVTQLRQTRKNSWRNK